MFTVTDRTELIDALGGDNLTNGLDDTPKIVFIDGVIDLRAGAADAQLPCAGFAEDDFSYDDYLDEFDPASFGRDEAPSGPLEDLRVASQEKQRTITGINIGPNTSLLGREDGGIEGGTLIAGSVDNIIIRNLDLSAPQDCFPRWDPTDSDAGRFDPEVDAISVVDSSRLWIDHNRLSGSGSPSLERFGTLFTDVDALIDIAFGSTDITISFNDFLDHASTLLIGDSDDSDDDDSGGGGETLAVTVHHNRFAVGRDAPHVRFGQVGVVNNVYLTDVEGYRSSIGVGVSAQLAMDDNVVIADADQDLASIIDVDGGTGLVERGTLVTQGNDPAEVLSLLEASNRRNDVQLTPEIATEPAAEIEIDPAAEVQRIVAEGVGPGLRLGS